MLVVLPMISALIFTIAANIIPNPEAFQAWQKVDGYTTSDVNIDSLEKVQIDCALDSKTLYATHPQQATKLYHQFNSGSYDVGKLTADSEACTMGSKFKNSKGKFPCLRPDIVYNVVLSDVYRDRCGHTYRGFKHVVYLKQNDNMGTLLALGRTIYPVPNSQFQGEMYDGPTYPVLVQEFLFLSPAFSGDEAKAQELKNQALRSTHSFDENTLLFASHIN